ncbi:MAG: NAD(P)H-hydrate dehydratase [Coriobacteriales bacterium]|jgi:NAD(P)H-hydrate epimerase|nr:NAD(P)H-hydrate dehydratase [Coriobacteriales bacterium]
MQLPTIERDANKYTRGCLLIVAGSARFPGAAILAAQAAARSGAGYTSLAIPASVVQVAQSHLLTVPVIAAAETNGAFAAHALVGILPQMQRIDAILCGPGLTVTESTRGFLANLLKQTACPLVLDADALNLLSETDLDGKLLWQSLPAGVILTPHAGELKRLLATTNTSTAAELALLLQAVVVAKGAETDVFSPEREVEPFHYQDGTAALAKAGSGDVLAGIIASLLAQGLTTWQAASYAVQIHGRAGSLAEVNGSRRSLIARDIIDTLSATFYEIEGT